jgi:predicted DCC family thiol-disulfide oxidoreductase YuxK
MTIDPGDHAYLLFDGDCGVCSRSAELARSIDRRGQWIIEPYQRFDESELKRFGLNNRLCSEKVRVIAPSGRAYGGAFAVNRFLLDYFPWMLIPIAIYILPPVLLAEIIAYAIVARNRHHISRWLGMNACLVRKSS